ncbi:MAG: molybdopterin molybdotransferase MoeA [Candidatus Promineifilaceae bacterium]|nr:molybdopterin molybdotransferase MoeA [Candidatus Promineifilaceae bacterium]
MPEFFNVLPPDEARSLLLEQMGPKIAPETVDTSVALGRVTVEPVAAPHALPSFRRSTMDGYAVKATDTFGASATLPAFLAVTGEIAMGKAATIELSKGEAVVVHTGGMLPAAADAVVQVEQTQAVGRSTGGRFPFEIEVFRAVAPGQNVLQVGEDVAEGSTVLPAGHLVRPQDVGALLALGITAVDVARRPRVVILATGDEVVAPDQSVGPGQIRDINSHTVAAQATKAGAIPILGGIVPDSFETLCKAAESGLDEGDMLVMSAGSSVSVRDLTVRVIDELGEPGVLLHGVATRPGKPTIVGVVSGKPVIGLPGNPVSAMIQFAMFGVPAIYRLQGLAQTPMSGSVWARVTQNIASETGREDYVPARLIETKEGLQTEPVFGKSNLIFTLVNADGLIKVPLNQGGLAAGEWVQVQLF